MPYESVQGCVYWCTNPLCVPRYTFKWLSTATSLILSPTDCYIIELHANVCTETKWGRLLRTIFTNLAVQSSDTEINCLSLINLILLILELCSLKLVKNWPVYLLNRRTNPLKYPMMITGSPISRLDTAELWWSSSRIHLPVDLFYKRVDPSSDPVNTYLSSIFTKTLFPFIWVLNELLSSTGNLI